MATHDSNGHFGEYTIYNANVQNECLRILCDFENEFRDFDTT